MYIMKYPDLWEICAKGLENLDPIVEEQKVPHPIFADVSSPTELAQRVSINGYISQQVCFNIDILSTATREFIDLVYDIENTIDRHERAKKAFDAIEDYNSWKALPGNSLVKMYNTHKQVPLPKFRMLYLLLMSIPDYKDLGKPWDIRGVHFGGAHLSEHIAVKYTYHGRPVQFFDNKLFNPITKTSTPRVDHENLRRGPGKDAVDHYIWDNSRADIPENRNSGMNYHMQPIDTKYCSYESFEVAKDAFKKAGHDHKAEVIFTYNEKLGWAAINYRTNTIEPLPWPLPKDAPRLEGKRIVWND